jgi:hypothetical protein
LQAKKIQVLPQINLIKAAQNEPKYSQILAKQFSKEENPGKTTIDGHCHQSFRYPQPNHHLRNGQ